MLIDMRNVHFRRKTNTIIEDVSWQVESGQHWAILGMNGAGKTTLLNLVCGYLFPTSGTIDVFGKRFGRFPLNELRKDIGWVSTSFSERMQHHTQATGLEIILTGKFASIGLHENPEQTDIDKALSLLEQLGIDRLRNRPFRLMSQGEKQRILIGRAFMAEPRLFILDEPCAGLDFLSKEQLLSTIQRMARQQKTTILFVTHQIDEILPIFSHTLLLREGAVFSQGATENQLTSATLSDFCRTKVDVGRRGERYYMDVALETKV